MIAQKVLFEKRATAIGSYWMSKAPRSAVLDYLRDQDLGRWKMASLGGEQESGFEQAFSSLAYAYLKDKSPRLLDFIVGFQLVDRNEDNTKAMGVFGFKVGEQWLYAPVFFLNGDLKGHELLYIKKQDSFVPMKENWVNYLISRKPHKLGEGSPQNTYELGGLMPNLMRLSRQPTGTKYGADQPGLIHIDDWAKPCLPLVFALATKQASSLYPGLTKAAGDLNFKAVVNDPFKAALAETADKFDMRNVLTTLPLLKFAFEQFYMKSPAIKAGFDRFYGKDFFLKAAEKLKQQSYEINIKQAASYIVPPKGSKGSYRGKMKGKDLFNIMPDKEEKEAFDKHSEITVFALDVDMDVPITVNKDELTEEEREKLLKDTVLIKDKRDPHGPNTSIAYNTQVRLELVNPSETGLYEILEKPGSFDRMVIIHNPHSGRGREDHCLVLRESAPRNWTNIHRTNVWAKSCDCPERDDFVKYVKGLSGTEDLTKGGVYVAIHENGSGTCPFRVRENYGNGVYKVEWKDHAQYGLGFGMSAMRHKSERSQDWEIGYSPWDAKVHITKSPGCKLRATNGELSIPDSYKIIKVQDPPPPKENDKYNLMCCGPASDSLEEHSEEEPIQCGNLVDIQIYLHKKAHTLKIHDTGAGEVWLKGSRGHERMSKKAALISLVRDHGLSEKQARSMLKEATAQGVHNRAAAYFIKYADPYNGGNSLQPGPTAPPFPQPMYGTESSGPGAQTSIYPQEEFQPVDSMSSMNTDPSIYDPFYTPDQNAMQVAQQAAMSGQKEVFDTSMISGMLKSVRQDSLVDRYLGDLMKALDKLGRILFMFYWHQEEFEDRYGKQDLPELEDSLRNSFETLGDVTLFLQEKTIKGGFGMMDGVGSPDQGEPSVEEAARN